MSGGTGPAAGGDDAGVAARARRTIDTTVAHSARVHDYWLGGKDNFAADRAAGDAVMEAYPGIVMSVRANRAFLARAVRFLADEAGIRQFLDVGTGIPAANNTHEVAQAIAPDCRVVYVDYDPIVISHARSLLAKSPGVIAVPGDMRAPEAILAYAALTDLIDLTQPSCVILSAIPHFVDAGQARDWRAASPGRSSPAAT